MKLPERPSGVVAAASPKTGMRRDLMNFTPSSFHSCSGK